MGRTDPGDLMSYTHVDTTLRRRGPHRLTIVHNLFNQLHWNVCNAHEILAIMYSMRYSVRAPLYMRRCLMEMTRRTRNASEFADICTDLGNGVTGSPPSPGW